MSDTATTNEQESHSIDAEALKAQFEELRKENESMKSHMERLLDETKKAKTKAQEAEEKSRKEAELKVAQEKGDMEAMIKDFQQQLEAKDKAYNDMVQKSHQEKINNKALELASGVASGGRAKILAEKLASRLTLSEDKFHVLNDDGQMTIDTPDKLLNKFRNNDDYKFLFDGVKATGGGANGNSNSVAQQSNTITSKAFKELTPEQQYEFSVVKKGNIVD